MFHHGNSTYPTARIERNPLKPEELVAFFQKFCAHLGFTRFSLMGYSMGGKVALVIAQALPDQLDKLVLIAPDGIQINGWYKLASGTAMGRWLSRRFVRNAKPLLRFSKTMRSLRLLPRHLDRLANIHLADPEHRKLMYNTWMSFRKIKPEISVLSLHLTMHAVPLLLVFGLYDRVIPREIGQKFVRRVPQAKLEILDAGHVLLTEEHLPVVTKFLSETDAY